MEKEFRSNLLECAKAWCALTGRKLTTAGIHAAGSDKFFKRLEDDESKSFNIRSYDRAMNWFRENWPDNEEYPDCLIKFQSDEVAQ